MARDKIGYIKLYRRSIADHSWLGKDGTGLAVFVWMLLEANWGDGWHPTKQGVFLKRAQLVTSPGALADQLRFARSTVQRKFDRMAQEKMVGLDVGTHGHIVTILNYDKYQGDLEEGGHPSGHPAGTPRAPRGHINREEQEEQEEQEKPPLRACASAGAPAHALIAWRRPGGWEEAKGQALLILAQVRSLRERGAKTAEQARPILGDVAFAAIEFCEPLASFYRNYLSERDGRDGDDHGAARRIADAKYRDMLASALMDQRFPPEAAETCRGGGATMGTAENAH